MAGQPYFIWNGQDSRIMGLWIQKHPPIIRPQMRFKEITIPGKAGALTLLEGEDIYEPYVREMQIMPKPNADIHQIVKWLTGSGNVTFSIEPDRIQGARIFDEVSLQHAFADQRTATVKFLCDPFKKSASSDNVIPIPVSPASYTINNPGDVVAFPIIQLTGSGGVAVTINGTRIAMTGVNGLVAINCESGAITGAGNIRTYGDFGSLAVGSNTITWEGTITALSIAPRWRWL